MNKLLAALVVSTFALGTVSAYAADAVKKEELTSAQRADMRTRADQLTRARANGTEHVSAKTTQAPVSKKVQHTTKKTTKVTRHTVKKSNVKQ